MKRLFDLMITIPAIICLAPIMFLLGILVKIFLGSPCLFIQERPGLYGQPFKLIKFRSMKDAFDREGLPLPDKERLTRFGKFLRASSLDEFPELFNVLKGDMSLVGPRPLLMEYLDLYTQEQARRHDVRPGITGWAQVNGRNDLSWEEKFTFDIWYVDNWSIILDVRILFLTIAKTIRREGISQPGQETAEKFKGTESSNEK